MVRLRELKNTNIERQQHFELLNISRVGRLTGGKVCCLFVLSGCFVKYFNISGSELEASCIKCTVTTIIIPLEKAVRPATPGVRILFAPCVV